MLIGNDRYKFAKLREDFQELQQRHQRLKEEYSQVRQDFLRKQSNRLRTHGGMIKIYATILNERYGKYDDLHYCSTQIIQNVEQIEEVARELRLFEQ